MIIIRVDFSSEIGFGHLRRIETFVKLKKGKKLIICKECNQQYTHIPLIKIQSEEEFFDKVKTLKPKEVIIDSYNFTYKDEKRFKTFFPNIKLICFDDTYQQHFCDLIIHPSPFAKLNKYSQKAIKIDLVDKKFKDIKLKKFKKKAIFISFGATDAKGIGLKVLKTLKPLKKEVHFYTTTENKNLQKLKKFCFLNRWCHLHINEDIAKAMAKAKFGIITSSQIALEALKIKMPFIAIQIADNQRYIANGLKSKNIKVLSEREIKKIPRFIP